MEIAGKTTGQKMKGLREAHGFTQKRLAEEAGITMQTVWLLESGRHEPRISTLRKIAGALDVPLSELLA